MDRIDAAAADHLRWAVDRALHYVDAGNLDEGLDSYMSDLHKFEPGGFGPVAMLDPRRTVLDAFQHGRAAVEQTLEALKLPTSAETNTTAPQPSDPRSARR